MAETGHGVPALPLMGWSVPSLVGALDDGWGVAMRRYWAVLLVAVLAVTVLGAPASAGRPRVSLVAPTSVVAGADIALVATVRRGARKQVARLQERVGGRWASVGQRKLKGGRTQKLTFTVPTETSGTRRFRVAVKAKGRTRSATSRAVEVTVAEREEPLATEVITDTETAGAEVPAAEYDDVDGVPVARTVVRVVLEASATASQWEDLLDRYDATVVSSVAGGTSASLRIPDPGSTAALREILDAMGREPGVRGALASTAILETAVPATATGPGVQRIGPQLAIQMAAAWQARPALGAPPTLLMADFFGRGVPLRDFFDVDVLRPQDFAVAPQTEPISHGYMVLGLLAATFDEAVADGSPPTLEQEATGTWAGGRLPMRAIDLASTTAPAGVLDDRMIKLATQTPGRLVLNTSLGSSCTDAARAAGTASCDEESFEILAQGWRDAVRAAGLEDRMVHVTAATNIGADETFRRADLGSHWNTAALESGDGVVNLSNTLVVENAWATDVVGEDTTTSVSCRSTSSRIGGNVTAVGMRVHSMGTPSTAGEYADGGTSSATPQVAGVVTSMWSLDSSVSAPQVVRRVLSTVRQHDDFALAGVAGCTPLVGPFQVIGAYRALRAMDRPGEEAVLEAVVDVTDGAAGGSAGRFDREDVDALVGELGADPGAESLRRTDLNGDGLVGGEGATAFDVDLADPVTFGEVEVQRFGEVLQLDEVRMTDQDVLCAAIASSAWDGTADEGLEALDTAGCLGVDFAIGVREVRASMSVFSESVCSVSQTASDGSSFFARDAVSENVTDRPDSLSESLSDSADEEEQPLGLSPDGGLLLASDELALESACESSAGITPVHQIPEVRTTASEATGSVAVQVTARRGVVDSLTMSGTSATDRDNHRAGEDLLRRTPPPGNCPDCLGGVQTRHTTATQARSTSVAAGRASATVVVARRTLLSAAIGAGREALEGRISIGGGEFGFERIGDDSLVLEPGEEYVLTIDEVGLDPGCTVTHEETESFPDGPLPEEPGSEAWILRTNHCVSREATDWLVTFEFQAAP